MSLKTIVKVGAITNLSDARYCAGMGVDMLGFCFSKDSDNYIEIEKFKEINNWVSGVEIIAEFDNESINEVEEILELHDFNGIMTSSFEVAEKLKSLGKKVILAFDVKSESDIEIINRHLENFSKFDYLQLNSDKEHFYPELERNIPSWSQYLNILKAFDIHSCHLKELVEQKLYKGIALVGSHEEKPGMKDYDEIADILEALDEEG